MKITYIHQHFKLPSEGGGSRPYEFARRMVADGHSVTMLCGGSEALEEEIDGILVKRIKVPYKNSMSASARMRSFFSFSVRSVLSASKNDTDVIFASSTPLTVAIPAIIGKFVQRVPMVFEVRDLWPSVPIELGYLNNPIAIAIASQLEKMAYGNAKKIVALSPGMKDGVLQVNPKKEVLVIPNACDFDLFEGLKEDREQFRRAVGWNSDETVLVYAGGFGPTYDLEWAVRVAAALKGEKIRFVLIGEGKDTNKLQALARSLGLDPEQLFLGMRAKTETARFVQSADIVLSCLADQPCLEVNSLNKVFDGLAAGRPIVLNHDGWLRDAIVDAGAGWKVDREIQRAAQQIIEIVSDKQSLQTASENSNQLGRSSFDRDLLYQQLITLIEDAIKH